MTGAGNEFARVVRVDTLGEAPRAMTIEATAEERAALARRFGLIGIDRLVATAELNRESLAVVARGRLEAAVVQSCSATGEPLPAEVDEPFALRFVPAHGGQADEVELSESELDDIGYDGAAVDLGEAVAETLALALDPFPRSPAADAALRDAGVLQEDEVETGPFAALKALRDKLGG